MGTYLRVLIMRDVHVICPQCGEHDAYLEQEPSDFTGVNIAIMQAIWTCPQCGYSDIQ